MRVTVPALALTLAAAGLIGCDGTAPTLSLEDEFAFRRLREDFHVANMTGDRDLMRSLWADDAVLTTDDGNEYVGGDAITDFLAANPNFGDSLVLTSESHWSAVVRGNIAEYGFESISIDVGGNDPTSTALSAGGVQNPVVEIVGHTNSTGLAARVEEGRWVLKELNSGSGPLPASRLARNEGAVPAQAPPEDPVADELGFLRMREDFHRAATTGNYDLLRSVWADDAVFTGGGNTITGGDAIADFMAGAATFGKLLMLTPESSARTVIRGDIAEYAFECIWIDVGDNDPTTALLCAPGGSQNPVVEIVRHSHTMGIAARVAEGRWVFKEFNGGPGPLPPAGP